MTLTKKQYDEVVANSAKVPWPFHALIWILKPAVRLLAGFGFVRRYLNGTFCGRSGAIFRAQKRGEHDKAADLAIDALKHFRHRKPSRFDPEIVHFTWWQFMRYAVLSLENSDDADKWDQIIEMAHDGIAPFEGYDVAYAFVGCARRKLAQGDYQAAVSFATIAARADQTWGEPDFLLGWYEMAVGGGDAMAHLSRAVNKDPEILPRIANDRVCGRHPHIIAKLEAMVTSGPDSTIGRSDPAAE